MIRVSVLYPKTNESTFDLDYYLNRQTPMMKERLTPFGLMRVEIDEGLGGLTPQEPPAHPILCHLVFEKIEDLQHGLMRHGAEITSDIANYTHVQPQIQVNRMLTVPGAVTGA